MEEVVMVKIMKIKEPKREVSELSLFILCFMEFEPKSCLKRSIIAGTRFQALFCVIRIEVRAAAIHLYTAQCRQLLTYEGFRGNY